VALLIRRRGRIAAAVAVAVALAAGSAVAGRLDVGDPLPAVVLPDRAGRTVSLAGRRGTVLCIDFWASWCAPCAAALPALDAIARRHRAAGLEVVAINIDGARARAEQFLDERVPAPAMTLLFDPEAALLSRFGAGGMPALYLVDRTGTVRLVEARYEPARLEVVERTIEALLREPAVPAPP
jgi:thiol-disulfide isomerase/thioredoxin